MLEKGKQIAYVPMSVIEEIGIMDVNEETIKGKDGVRYGFILEKKPYSDADKGISYYTCMYWTGNGEVGSAEHTQEHFILELETNYVDQSLVDVHLT
jgi:hypothetical protein